MKANQNTLVEGLHNTTDTTNGQMAREVYPLDVRPARVGQIINYMCYGKVRKGLVCRVTDNGTIFLSSGRFVFPQSVISDLNTVASDAVTQ